MAGPVLRAGNMVSDEPDAISRCTELPETRIWRITMHVTGQEMHRVLGGSSREGKGYKNGHVRAGLTS